MNILKATRIKKIAKIDDSNSLPEILLEYKPMMKVQSSKFPFDDLPTIRSSIWTPFKEVYENHKEILEGTLHFMVSKLEFLFRISVECFQCTYFVSRRYL